MRLADLVDLELQLLRDQDMDSGELRRRDRALGRELVSGLDVDTVQGRHALFGQWLQRVRPKGATSAGRRLERGLRLLRWALIGLGVITGAGTAKALLAYDGSVPINAVHFLGVLVVLQLLLLVLLVLGSFARRRSRFLTQLGPLQRLFRYLTSAWGRVPQAVRGWVPEQDRGELSAMWGRGRSHGQVYGRAERWLLMGLSQAFGVAFNVAALVTGLYLVTFSDLAFGWSSTLNFDSAGFHGFISVLATPWDWVVPLGSPSLELVEQTRFFRLDAGHLSGFPTDPSIWGGWWPFLFLSVTVYGLFPRAVALVYATARARGTLRNLSLDHGELQNLFERLTAARVDTRATDGGGYRGAELNATALASRELPPDARGGDARTCTVLVWGGAPIGDDALMRTIETRFAKTVSARFDAGGGDFAADDRTCADLAGHAKASAGPFVMVAEAIEAPTKEVVAFVKNLRAAVGPRRLVDVALLDQTESGKWVGPNAEDLRVWTITLEALGDAYLRVVSAVEEP